MIRRLTIALSLFLIFSVEALAQQDTCQRQTGPFPFEFGVVRMNLDRTKNWKTIIDDMSRSRVKTARLSLKGDFKKSFEAIQYAHKSGINVLVGVTLVQPQLQQATAMVRSGKGRLKDQYGLSGLDLTRYESVLREFLQRLDSAGIALSAIEVGNEINWADFNGDLPIYGNGVVIRDLKELGGAQQKVMAGLEKYAEAVRITKRLLSESKLQKQTKIISAGLVSKNEDADLGAWFVRAGGTVLAVNLMNRIYEQLGIANLFDGRGIHIYPQLKPRDAIEPKAFNEIKRIVRNSAQACSPRGEACYVTEWGFNSAHSGCDGTDPRMSLFTDFLSAASCHNNIKALYLFSWDDVSRKTNKDKDIWRCGRVSPVVNLFK